MQIRPGAPSLSRRESAMAAADQLRRQQLHSRCGLPLAHAIWPRYQVMWIDSGQQQVPETAEGASTGLCCSPDCRKDGRLRRADEGGRNCSNDAFKILVCMVSLLRLLCGSCLKWSKGLLSKVPEKGACRSAGDAEGRLRRNAPAAKCHLQLSSADRYQISIACVCSRLW